jgi:cyclopropane fatty-acyl-phospholipid synthase-like methyltransferase
MQITSGVRSILSSPIVYDFFQDLMGSHRIRTEFVQQHIRPNQGMRILDIGCGTARILDYLPDVEYYGFDLSREYIDDATRRYGKRGKFKCAFVEQEVIDQIEAFDIVIAIGLLHHLDDAQAQALMTLAKSALTKGGKLVTIDPCYAVGQNAFARFLVSRDRGQNVRSVEQYQSLAYEVFPEVKSEIRHRTWIPYTHCIMECQK